MTTVEIIKSYCKLKAEKTHQCVNVDDVILGFSLEYKDIVEIVLDELCPINKMELLAIYADKAVLQSGRDGLLELLEFVKEYSK